MTKCGYCGSEIDVDGEVLHLPAELCAHLESQGTAPTQHGQRSTCGCYRRGRSFFPCAEHEHLLHDRAWELYGDSTASAAGRAPTLQVDHYCQADGVMQRLDFDASSGAFVCPVCCDEVTIAKGKAEAAPLDPDREAFLQGLGPLEPVARELLHRMRAEIEAEAAPPRAQDWHQQIMNLPCVPPEGYPGGHYATAYKQGHRDARHAAAELVNSPASPPHETD